MITYASLSIDERFADNLKKHQETVVFYADGSLPSSDQQRRLHSGSNAPVTPPSSSAHRQTSPPSRNSSTQQVPRPSKLPNLDVIDLSTHSNIIRQITYLCGVFTEPPKVVYCWEGYVT
ncbi:hypothetical protein HPB50_028854 [Hyalomma asiaticum]|nr:hypothetical protein HPB50_028854 [Hyalomma asiaticum]